METSRVVRPETNPAERGPRGYLSLEGVDVSQIHREWQLTNTLWAATQRSLALIFFILSMPLFLVLLLPVCISSRGSFFYRQARPGFMGRSFKIVKIRSMRVNSDQNKELQKGVTKDDPNVTGIGRILRATKIDELPQLWNVLMGDMEFVGPRPIAQGLNDSLAESIPGFNRRYLVKPGLTNISQVSVLDNAVGEKMLDDWKLRFEGEEHYIKHKSISYDMILIVMTVVFMVRKLVRRH